MSPEPTIVTYSHSVARSFLRIGLVVSAIENAFLVLAYDLALDGLLDRLGAFNGII